MKNVIIMIVSLFACIIADIFGGFGSSVTDINPVTTSTDITAVTSVTSAAETTNNIVSDDIIDNSVAPEITTEYTAIYTEYTDIIIETVCSEPAAAPELVTDAESNIDTASDIQDDKTDIDNTDVYNINNLYALTAVISEINYNDDIVCCTDFNGFIWSFVGVEDYCINDIVSMVMYDNNTDIITDDIIINCRYSSYIDTTDNNTVSDICDISDNTDTVSDNTDNTDISENDLFIEYLNTIENGDYIE